MQCENSALGSIGPLQIVKGLGLPGTLRLLSSRVLSMNHYFVLRKNLLERDNPVETSAKKMEISPITESDISWILGNLEHCGVADRRDLLAYLLFYRGGFRNCFVMRRGEEVAYLQTLITPSDNELIRKKYRNKFYQLKETQVMIENVFTFPPFRGLGCFQSGTQQLLALARGQGFRSALCYVRKDRVGALTELVNMGFKITKLMPEYKVLGAQWRVL